MDHIVENALQLIHLILELEDVLPCQRHIISNVLHQLLVRMQFVSFIIGLK
jgi:hypothetical protein